MKLREFELRHKEVVRTAICIGRVARSQGGIKPSYPSGACMYRSPEDRSFVLHILRCHLVLYTIFDIISTHFVSRIYLVEEEENNETRSASGGCRISCEAKPR